MVPILVVEPIPDVDSIPPIPILPLYEVNTIPIPIPKKMESQQRYTEPFILLEGTKIQFIFYGPMSNSIVEIGP